MALTVRELLPLTSITVEASAALTLNELFNMVVDPAPVVRVELRTSPALSVRVLVALLADPVECCDACPPTLFPVPLTPPE